MRILFLVPYPLAESPSQRFRFEQYFETLRKEGHSYRVQSFLDTHKWRQFAAPGRMMFKLFLFVSGVMRRSLVLFTLYDYDVIFVHREAAPVGPPLFEWLIAKGFRKRVVYDFDDALWLTDKPNESNFLRSIKWRSKIGSICRWCYKVSCGNEFLCRYARQFSKRVVYNPTTIDTEGLHVPHLGRNKSENLITIGWTGSNSTLKYLKSLEPVLVDVEKGSDAVQFMVIGDRPPLLKLKRLIFKPWNRDTEIEDLMQFDIGIMPLPDDEWAKGKCAFKALQYMALEIPTVASSVGVNPSVIDHGVNGFLASSAADWRRLLFLLIENKDLRTNIGKKGRLKVLDQYSVRSNEARFLSLFT